MKRLLRDIGGATAVEFAMVLPLLIILLLGIIDAGRFAWEYNRAEKATQMGARMAVVTDVLDSGLMTTGYVGKAVGSTFLTQGDRIPASAFGTLTCTNGSCTCTGDCGTAGTYNQAAFNRIVARMAAFKPDITADDVTIEYRSSGLGFAGAPNVYEDIGGVTTQVSGMDVSPLVTVQLNNLSFTPIFLFNQVDLPMPSFATSLTAEDGFGSASN